MNTYKDKLHLKSDEGIEHFINIEFSFDSQSDMYHADLSATYESGTSEIQPGSIVVEWCASYVPPNQFDSGSAAIGDGRIDLKVESLRGIGLGSLLMQPLIRWIKSYPVVPIQPINLAGDDAKTIEARNRRNRFYDKLGFKFDYKDDRTWGESGILQSNELVTPKFKLSKGWHIENYQSGIFQR